MPTVIPEKFQDLLEKKIFVSLATLMPDGRPQVSPVWFDLDGQHVVVNLGKRRVRGAGRVCVFAAVSAPVWERRTPAAVCAGLPCLPHSIPRRTSGAVPGGSHNGCTGAPGHRVAGRCTVDGSNQSRWRIFGRRW